MYRTRHVLYLELLMMSDHLAGRNLGSLKVGNQKQRGVREIIVVTKAAMYSEGEMETGDQNHKSGLQAEGK